MKKLILLLILPLFLFAQEQVAIAIYQDAKLLVAGDGYYKPGTVNVLVKLEMQGHQSNYGYLTVAPEFEIANIDGNYKRYAATVGYTFTYIIKKTEQNISVGYGFLERFGKSTSCFTASATLGYKLTNKLNIELLAQLQERKDLQWLYNDYLWRFSGFVGLKYKI